MSCAFKMYYSRSIANFTHMFNSDIAKKSRIFPGFFVILLSVFLKEACAKGEFFLLVLIRLSF